MPYSGLVPIASCGRGLCCAGLVVLGRLGSDDQVGLDGCVCVRTGSSPVCVSHFTLPFLTGSLVGILFMLPDEGEVTGLSLKFP